MSDDDHRLLQAWGSGDRSAGDQLVQRHFDAVYRFFAGKLDTDVSDLVQRTFLGCLEACERFRGESSLRTFLFAIARHELYAFFRQRQRDQNLDFTITSLQDLAPSPSHWAARHEEEGLLRMALRDLPLDLQVAIELYYFEDIRGAELAEVLEVPPGTARSRIRRGLEALRGHLAGYRTPELSVEPTLSKVNDWEAKLEQEPA